MIPLINFTVKQWIAPCQCGFTRHWYLLTLVFTHIGVHKPYPFEGQTRLGVSKPGLTRVMQSYRRIMQPGSALNGRAQSAIRQSERY